jgi:hypothetical protein
MAINLNKSNFMTKIGVMYYLWSSKGGSVVVSYLGVGKENFLRYLKKLGNKNGDQNRILLNGKKTGFKNNISDRHGVPEKDMEKCCSCTIRENGKLSGGNGRSRI